jgi:hypothetical protein
MPCYSTNYLIPGGNSCHTTVYAKDRAHLDKLLTTRNLGEYCTGVVDSNNSFFGLRRPIMPSEHLKKGDLSQCMHALIWAGMIAGRAFAQDGFEVLHDESVIHAFAHYMTQPSATYAPVITRIVETYERSIPGLHPHWAGEEDIHKKSWKPIFGDYSSLEIRIEEQLKAKRQTLHTLLYDDYAFLGDDTPKDPQPKPPAVTSRAKEHKVAQAQLMQGAKAKAEMVKTQLEKLKSKIPEKVEVEPIKQDSDLGRFQAAPRLHRSKSSVFVDLEVYDYA